MLFPRLQENTENEAGEHEGESGVALGKQEDAELQGNQVLRMGTGRPEAVSQPARPGPSSSQLFGSAGRPLDAATRAFFEPRFQRDFSEVRIHADARAHEAAERLDAHAFTVESHIVLGDSAEAHSQRVLAHELTHVVQSGGSTLRVSADASQTRTRPRIAERAPDALLRQGRRRGINLDTYLQRLFIALEAGGVDVITGIYIGLLGILVVFAIAAAIAAAFPEFAAAVTVVLAETMIFGASLASWLAALGIAYAVSELVMAFLELDAVLRQPDPSRERIEAAGRAWGRRSGEALALFLTTLGTLAARALASVRGSILRDLGLPGTRAAAPPRVAPRPAQTAPPPPPPVAAVEAAQAEMVAAEAEVVAAEAAAPPVPPQPRPRPLGSLTAGPPRVLTTQFGDRLRVRPGGQVDSLTGRLRPQQLRTGTGTTEASRAAAQAQHEVFDAGHLRARLLGGRGGLEGTFPQWSHVNRGMFQQFEGRLAQLVRSASPSDRIFFSVQPRYASATAEVPSQVYYQVRINGETVVRALFSNVPGRSYLRFIPYPR
jgi:hypothetical protein